MYMTGTTHFATHVEGESAFRKVTQTATLELHNDGTARIVYLRAIGHAAPARSGRIHWPEDAGGLAEQITHAGVGMSRHSSIVGGSTAGRLLECPGSYQAQLALPPSADVSSEYALEGTAMHAVMDMLMRARKEQEPLNSTLDQAAFCVGYPIADRHLTQEHLDTMIFPALEQLEALEEQYGGDFRVVGVEQRVQFPGLPGAFGTCDLILASPTHILHIDWKFGQGLAVEAVYFEGDSLSERLNPQMMFYTTAAMHSCKKIYKGKKELVIAIIQPRSTKPLTHTVISKVDVKYFTEDLHNAVIAALDRDPPRARGEHCRFAPCKVACPLWTGPMLDLAAMGVVQPRTEVVVNEPSAYSDYIAKAKELADLAAIFKKEVDEQLHAYLEDGGYVPGWKLKAKTKLRQWVDELTVEKALTELGFDAHDVFESKLVTFAKAEATAKRLGVKIPDHLRIAPATNETTVTRSDDPAPPVNRTLAVDQFRAALAHFNPQKG